MITENKLIHSKKMNKAKNDWIESQCKSIDYDMHHGKHNKHAYEKLKMLTKTKSRITSIIEDSTD